MSLTLRQGRGSQIKNMAKISVTHLGHSRPMRHDTNDPFHVTYFNIRQSLGVIAMIFPLGLLLGGYITEGHVLPSISDYYFSSMRDFVVGALVAIGLFLMAYRAERRPDTDWLDTLTGLGAGAAAIGLALFPNKPHATGVETFFHAIMDDRISVALHFLSSFVFLTTLTLYCLRIFARAAPVGERRFYQICGWTIVASGIIATFASFVRAFDWFQAQAIVEHLNLIFWLEAAGIWAFCAAWLLKGQTERRAASVPQSASSRHLASRWVPSQ
ncbi:hypothetical protein [Cognatishimia maritima]|uniref:DUF998 domain-containing protein n=1 Tax=Cognatishimia maritima TaxID=870908 RepID=A0A1M5P8J8_9RHOB|nr:hypothetical protein [Cognatishimia maritima]SHG98098.1 hypothetical protein SAMN04488044_1744 [Cognatishimia maritima]